MIRSNPTAIPLRANDVKLLQAEIDKRKAAREAASASASAAAASSTSGNGTDSSSSVDPARKGLSTQTHGGVDKHGRSVAERIGL
ncbi:hypothetical protein I317_02441 [Kwoniella heveanensis CBS 569]|uniref:Uncharacterized protein n=1 Tax=Kwoniella heveanensis BCC8398 TaxID=1296120 RepID=A0A1B9GT62_9TREE|nr:hypothetical protein I316_04182 [Kwoniella heveanensis BCC8398]OCF43690.1 hypothetical protein I317_02441 [Kwoniella heveanensis CBS 569]